jgi:UDPglucose 6-dehydrogenase
MENPDRVLIGSMDTPSGRAARDELIKIYERWVPREKLVTSQIWSSELSKLVSNAFLAQRISSINSISGLCEITEADVDEVARAVGKDSRIGPKFLRAGLGFGGSCFRKDILNLIYLCEHYGLQPAADFWQQVIAINDFQMQRFVQRMLTAMFNTVVDKKIALFGFAFKPDTGDTRDSPALHISKMLLKERARLCITDPHALNNARQDLEGVEGDIVYESDPYKAAEGAHAIALMTEWDQYRSLDYRRIFDRMEKPAFLFDGRNHLDHKALFDLGFNVYAVGKPDRTQFHNDSQ